MATIFVHVMTSYTAIAPCDPCTRMNVYEGKMKIPLNVHTSCLAVSRMFYHLIAYIFRYAFWQNNMIMFMTNPQLEQLERLRSEDTPCRLMITPTIKSYWIPSEKKTKSKSKI